MAKVRELLVEIVGDDSDLQKTLASAARGLDVTGKRLQDVGSRLTTYVTAPAAAAAGALVGLAFQAAEFGESIADASARTGIATGDVQRLMFATDQLGSSFEAVEGAVAQLARQLPTLEEGTSPAARVFARLGVSARDSAGELRPMGELLPDIIDALGRIRNPTERAAAAAQLFGRRAQDLQPLLAAGGEEVRRLMGRLDELGGVLDDTSVQKLARFKDQTDEVRVQLKALGADVGLAVIPVLQQQLVPLIQNEVVPRLQDLAGILKNLDGDGLKAIAALVIPVAAAGPALVAVGLGAQAAAAGLGLLRFVGIPVAGLFSPGGALLVGAALLAGLWAKQKVEAVQLAIETAKLREQYRGLSQEARELAGAQLSNAIVGAMREQAEAFDRLEEARARAGRIGGRGPGGAAEPIVPPDFAKEREAFEAARARTQELIRAREALQSVNRDVAQGELDLAKASEQVKDAIEDVIVPTEEAAKKVRTVKDVLAELSAEMDRAAALEGVSKVFEADALAAGQLESALRELATIGTPEAQRAMQLLGPMLTAIRGRLADATVKTKELTEAQRELAAIIASGRTPAEVLIDKLGQLEEWLEQGEISAEQFTLGNKVLLEQLAALGTEGAASVDTLGAALQTTALEGLDAFVTFADGSRRSFREFIESAIADLVRLQARMAALRILKALTDDSEGGVSTGDVLGLGGTILGTAIGGPLGGLVGGAIGGFFGGKRASGGPVSAGTLYEVNEGGHREFFQPNVGGTVIPLGKSRVVPELGSAGFASSMAAGRVSSAQAAPSGPDPRAFADAVIGRLGPIPSPMHPQEVARDKWYRDFAHFMLEEAMRSRSRFVNRPDR